MQKISRKSLRKLTQVYYVFWGGLAIVALFYLSSLVLFSNKSSRTSARHMVPSAPSLRLEDEFAIPARQFPPTRPLATGAIFDKQETTRAIHEDIASLRRDLKILEKRLGSIEDGNTTFAKKLGTLERNLAVTKTNFSRQSPNNAIEITGSVIPRANTAKDVVLLPATTGSINKGAPKPSGSIRVRYMPLPPGNFGDTAQGDHQISLDHIEEPTQTVFGLYLGSGRNLEEIRAHWHNLKKIYGNYFGTLEGRYFHNAAPHGRPFRLLAGPFTNVTDAVKICAELRSKAIGCKQTQFVGKAL